mmetsp:Transcript_8198/g.24600  ORF Transcript_8198/g.24600 Transcript_8198/m.24600 type:complete len:246 (-) Transcript_8198:984-1721(-)
MSEDLYCFCLPSSGTTSWERADRACPISPSADGDFPIKMASVLGALTTPAAETPPKKILAPRIVPPAGSKSSPKAALTIAWAFWCLSATRSVKNLSAGDPSGMTTDLRTRPSTDLRSSTATLDSFLVSGSTRVALAPAPARMVATSDGKAGYLIWSERLPPMVAAARTCCEATFAMWADRAAPLTPPESARASMASLRVVRHPSSTPLEFCCTKLSSWILEMLIRSVSEGAAAVPASSPPQAALS